MNKPVLNERVLPTKLCSDVIEIDWFRRFTLKERLKILLGFNLIVGVRIGTQHKPGKFAQIIIGELSDQPTAAEHLKARLERAAKILQGGYVDH